MNARDEGYSFDSKGIFSAQGHHAVLPTEEISNVDIDDIYPEMVSK